MCFRLQSTLEALTTIKMWKTSTLTILLLDIFLTSSAFEGLSDFGGDVSEYMSLLQGTSAFSFKPSTAGTREEPKELKKSSFKRQNNQGAAPSSQGHRSSAPSRRASKAGSRSESALGDFGGDYGNYLKLLEGDSALGFNPQSDTISDNQDLQSDVFGGGMSGKFWDMYKGSASYDSFDDADSQMMDPDSAKRQSPEEDQPEDESNPSRGERSENPKGDTVIVALKPSKSKMTKIFSDFKSALKLGDKEKMGKILDSLDLEKMLADESEGSSEVVRKSFDLTDDSDKKWSQLDGDDDDTESFDRKRDELSTDKIERKIETISKKDEEEDGDDYSKEYQTESETRGVLKNFEEFVEKMKKTVPDPIATSKGLAMSYKNLTLFGLSGMKVCGSVKKGFGLGSETWTSEICLPRLTTTIDCVTGPGVPFRGKVVAIFKQPKIKITFQERSSSSMIHVQSVKTVETEGSKFVPTYDSSIPLNPWSKVSLSGYMVARVKKMLPSLIDKTILKISHIVENMDKEET